MQTVIALLFSLTFVFGLFFLWAYAHENNRRRKYFLNDRKKRRK